MLIHRLLFIISIFFFSQSFSQNTDWLPIPLHAQSNYSSWNWYYRTLIPMRADSIRVDSSGVFYGVYWKAYNEKWNSCFDNGGIDSTKQLVLGRMIYDSFIVDSIFIHLCYGNKKFRIPYGVEIGETRSFNPYCNIRYVSTYFDQFLDQSVEVKEFELTRKLDGSVLGLLKLSKKLGIIMMPKLESLDREDPLFVVSPLLGIEFDSGDILGEELPKFGNELKYAIGDQLFITETKMDPIYPDIITDHIVTIVDIDTSSGNYKIELSKDIGGGSVIDFTMFQDILREDYYPVNTLRRSQNGDSWLRLCYFSNEAWNEYYVFSRYHGDSCELHNYYGNLDTIITKEFGLCEWGDQITHHFKLNKIVGKNYNYTVGEEELLSTDNKIELYPNPVLNVLNLNSNGSMAILRCMDISGSLVLNKRVIFPAQLDVRTFKSGVYFIQLELPDGNVENLKFVKN